MPPKTPLDSLAAGNARREVREAPAARIGLLVREAAYGAGMAELVACTGMLERDIATAAASAGLVTLPRSWYVDCAWFETARNALVTAVREFHRANPLLPGIGKEDLRARGLGGAPAFLLDELLAEAPDIVAEGDTVRLRSHRMSLKEDEEQARAGIERAFEQAGLATPGLAEVLARSGVEPARARSLLAILLRERKLVRIGEDLAFHHTAVENLCAMLAAWRPGRTRGEKNSGWNSIHGVADLGDHEHFHEQGRHEDRKPNHRDPLEQ